MSLRLWQYDWQTGHMFSRYQCWVLGKWFSCNNISLPSLLQFHFCSHLSVVLRWWTGFLLNLMQGIYSDSSSLLFHGHPQMQQRSLGPFMPVLPSISGHGRLYNARELPNSDPRYHQHLVSQNISYVAAQDPFSQTKLPDNIELPGDDNRMGPRPSYLPLPGSLGGGSSFSRHSGGFKFLQQGFEGIESGELWADWSKPSNGKSTLVHFSSQAASPKQIGSVGLSANHCGMVSFLIYDQLFPL